MKYLQKRRQRRVRQAIDNTKRLKALTEAERARHKALQGEINAKKELETLRAKTRQLKGRRGSTDLRKGIKSVGKTLSKLDRMVFGKPKRRRK